MKTIKLLSLMLVCGLVTVSCDKDAQPVSEDSQINRVAKAAEHFVDAIDPEVVSEKINLTADIIKDFAALDSVAAEPFLHDIYAIIESMDLDGDTTVTAATASTLRQMRIEHDVLIDLARFAAKYTLSKEGYKKENSDHILIQMTGEDGVVSKFEAKYSGKRNILTLLTDESWYTEWEPERTEVYEKAIISAVLPGKLELSLTRGAAKIAGLTISDEIEAGKIEDISVLNGKNNVSISVTASPYKATVSASTGSEKVKAGISLAKGSKTMLALNGTLNGVKAVEEEIDIKSLAKATLSADLMGEVQVKASTDNLYDLLNTIEGDYKNDEIPEMVQKVNSKFNAGVYYDNGSHKHASIKLAAISEEADEDMNGDRRVDEKDVCYEAIPVVYFEDKSSFATMEGIIGNERFEKVLEKALEKISQLSEVLDNVNI